MDTKPNEPPISDFLIIRSDLLILFVFLLIVKKSENLPNGNLAKFDNGSAANMTNRQPATNDHVETVDRHTHVCELM